MVGRATNRPTRSPDPRKTTKSTPLPPEESQRRSKKTKEEKCCVEGPEENKSTNAPSDFQTAHFIRYSLRRSHYYDLCIRLRAMPRAGISRAVGAFRGRTARNKPARGNAPGLAATLCFEGQRSETLRSVKALIKYVLITVMGRSVRLEKWSIVPREFAELCLAAEDANFQLIAPALARLKELLCEPVLVASRAEE